MKKVLLGMSGGVDSSVAAILLLKQGYKVIGVTMRLWEEEKRLNESLLNNEGSRLMEKSNLKENTAIQDAKKVCENLEIEHHVVDLRQEFKEKVIDNFVCTYMCAKTPNPCVECNKYMKFDAFYRIAEEFGCEYIATGHYARCYYSEKYNQYVLAQAVSSTKDQSYFLYGIDRKILPYVLFPLSEFEDKEEVRKIAEEYGMEIAHKKDSQEVCFIPDNDYISFLKKQSLKENGNSAITNIMTENKISINKSGNIVLGNGKVLGMHDGLINYTVGQRRGLGIAYKEPLYVVKLNRDRNEVIVGTEKELYTDTLFANELNFLIDMKELINKKSNNEIEIEAKIRYRAKPAKATLNIEKNVAKLKFYEPQRAITPGQSVVFYINEVVLGGGKIM